MVRKDCKAPNSQQSVTTNNGQGVSKDVSLAQDQCHDIECYIHLVQYINAYFSL